MTVSEKDAQEKYFQFQLLAQQVEQLDQVISTLRKQVEELNSLKQTLEEITHIPEGNELLVPLGAGIFLKASLKDTKELLMNVGSKVVVKKTPFEALEMIKIQVEEITRVLEDSEKEHAKLATEQGALQEEVSALMGES